MIKIFKDIILFALIFSFINDNTTEVLLGPFGVKALFILFVAVNIPDILRYATRSFGSSTMKSFYFFITIFAIVVLVSIIFFDLVDLSSGFIFPVSIFIIFTYFTYYEEFEKVLYFIWASVFASSIISLFNEPVSQYTFRRGGGNLSPDEFASHLLLAIFITIYLYSRNKKLIFLVPSLLMFMYATLYTGSKTALLILFVLFVYTLIVRFSNVFKYIFSLKGMVSLAVILGIFIQADLYNKISAFKGIQERAKSMRTAEQRFHAWDASTRMIPDHFFIGVGVNQFYKNTDKYLRAYLPVRDLHPHNNFIKIFAEAGIFSFLSFVIFLFFLFSEKYKKIIRSDYYWISLASLSSVLVGMTINSTYDKYFWLGLALLSHVIYKLGQEDSNHMIFHEI
jgi:O-antigen ligase